MNFQAFIGPSYVSQSPIADVEETINLYVERLESEGATVRTALYPTPGVQLLDTASVGPGRGHFAMDGREFAVIGSTFYEVAESGLLTSRGTVALDGLPATISSNGDGGGELFITAGKNGYLFTLATNVLTTIAFLTGKATMGGMLDGYFLALDATTSTLYISDLLDGSTWDPTQFAQRSIAPDPWIAMRVFGRYIMLFGEQTSELWYNTGASPFPFAPHPSGLVQYGIAAPFSHAVLGRELIWLGRSIEGRGRILKAAGFTPEVISTYPVQSAIDDYQKVDLAVGDGYTELGHSFYLLSFGTAGVTWAWDSETGLWAKRGTWVPDSNAYVAWRPRFHAFAFGEHRMLDSDNGAIYTMSVELLTDADSLQIRRLRRAPAIVTEDERLFYSEFQLYLESGLGTTSGQGADPQVMLRMSNDGGKTWGSEMWRSAGKIGEYSVRVNWHRLGVARRRVFEVVVTDPIPWRWVAAYMKVSPSTGARRGQPAQAQAQ